MVHFNLTWLDRFDNGGLAFFVCLWAARLKSAAVFLKRNSSGAVAWCFWTSIAAGRCRNCQTTYAYLMLSQYTLCCWNKQIHRQVGQEKKDNAFNIWPFSFLGFRFFSRFGFLGFVMICPGIFCRCHAPGGPGRTRLGNSDWLIDGRSPTDDVCRRKPRFAWLQMLQALPIPQWLQFQPSRPEAEAVEARLTFRSSDFFLSFDNLIFKAGPKFSFGSLLS